MTGYPLTVFFDGACPICAREIAVMKRLDRRQRLAFVDFSTLASDAMSTDLDAADLARVIHARWADGSVITGVDVFRAMWDAVGLGVVSGLTRLPFIEPLVLRAYAWFARNRLRPTGRADACLGGVCAESSSTPQDSHETAR